MYCMDLLKNLQQKTPAQKFRILWITVIVIVIVMVIVWVVSAQFYKNTETDTTLFQSIGKGIKDVRDNYKK